MRQCVEEVEKRGIEEVGIYRISGVATDIQALKAVFDASESGSSTPLGGLRGGKQSTGAVSKLGQGPLETRSSPCTGLHLPLQRSRGQWPGVSWVRVSFYISLPSGSPP